MYKYPLKLIEWPKKMLKKFSENEKHFVLQNKSFIFKVTVTWNELCKYLKSTIQDHLNRDALKS